MNLAREQYIESEYKKWEEKFEIPFEKEFDVKALLSLRHQFLTLPDEHVKAKADILTTISRINGGLNLKKRTILKDEDKLKVMFVVDDHVKLKELEGVFLSSIKEHTGYVSTSDQSTIKTDKINITIHLNNDQLRGQKPDFVYEILSKN